METSRDNILDIAVSCGFHNMSNFYKQYKKYYHSLPTEWKK